MAVGNAQAKGTVGCVDGSCLNAGCFLDVGRYNCRMKIEHLGCYRFELQLSTNNIDQAILQVSIKKEISCDFHVTDPVSLFSKVLKLFKR
jgi:hypothetical protein